MTDWNKDVRQRNVESVMNPLESKQAVPDRPANLEVSRSWFNLGRDRWNVCVLLFLYVLQGIPLGLAGCMPMILQGRKADYHMQAFFSFAFWPFSIKLLWAPIVDSIYHTRFGRRKSWLVPVQYSIGLFLFALSYNIKSLLGEEGRPIEILPLTFTFVCLCFLAATQDIAVDGWALTMLSRDNVGWASTTNSVGQTAGYFLGNVVFLALESPEFCNNYLRSTPQEAGIVTLGGYMFFWAWVFVIATTLTMLFKHETSENEEHPDGVIDTYKMLWRIIKLPAVQWYCFILLTSKMAFAATDSLSGLKMIEGGMSKERLALLAVPMVPVQILLPLIISSYTSGSLPLYVFVKAYPCRILMGLVFAGLVWITPQMKDDDGHFPVSFYALLLLAYALQQVTIYCMFVGTMAFSAKVSDPVVGGTYMTLLNTIANLGGNWPATLALYVVDSLNITRKEGDSVVKDVDGFYIETVICSVIGFVWLLWQHRKIHNLQTLPSSAWKVK